MSTPKPSIEQLWQQSGGNGDRYRELMRQHGYILSPGDEGYEEGSRTLACGWPGTTTDRPPGPEAREALLSLAEALDRKAAGQHGEAKAIQRLGREASARTITAIARAYEVSAAMARRRAESSPAPATEAAPVSREGQEPGGESEAPQRVALGMLVRAVWVAWAREQPDARPSWLAGWAELDEGQREVDMRIGEAVAKAERARLYAELGNDHYVIFTEDDMTTEHSVGCRLSGQMSTCEYHQAVVQVADVPDPDLIGRWRITGISEGLPDLERADG